MLLGLFAETPLHPGSGTTTGVVDLPVQREKHTGFPIIQSSGLKGAMREAAEIKWPSTYVGPRKITDPVVSVIFGPENTDHAGSIGVTDARLLAFPVRSLSSVYVWVTCPSVLNRLKRDINILKRMVPSLPDLPVTPNIIDGTALSAAESDLDPKLILEEHILTLDKSNPGVKQWIAAISNFLPGDGGSDIYKGARAKMSGHLVIISDTDFTYLVNYATQVTARNVLDDKKKSKNLWYEESLPVDSLLYTMIFAMDPRGGNGAVLNADDVITKLESAIQGYIRIGGNETIGMGWCAVKHYPDTGDRS